MNIALLILISIASLFLIGLLVLGFLYYASSKKNRNVSSELVRYTANIQATIDSSIPKILDALIEDCFRDYQIKVLVPMQEMFITDEREKKIREDLVDIVTDRLSPVTLDKIGLFYNIREIDKIIADKIYITVMNYRVDHNAPYANNENIDTRNAAHLAQQLANQ